ncbi:MAG: prepilin-type N-terminal cleavage/methylation domain-containing protein [Chitinispirillaceae bacterium]|nr:prepilin-type N-terminal cleavage/methylation domain-containing protein [Chitinispirillaceae bacterium]
MTGNDRHPCGVTLLELLIAITIAGIVVTLGFAVYGNIVTLFSRQSRAADDLRSTILMKKRIDQSCSRISVLHRCTDREVSGINSSTDSVVILRCAGNTLFDGHDTIAAGLEKFAFSLVEDKKDARNRNAVLLWEGVLVKTGDWIGGAVALKR